MKALLNSLCVPALAGLLYAGPAFAKPSDLLNQLNNKSHKVMTLHAIKTRVDRRDTLSKPHMQTQAHMSAIGHAAAEIPNTAQIQARRTRCGAHQACHSAAPAQKGLKALFQAPPARLHMQTQAHLAAISHATSHLADTGETESAGHLARSQAQGRRLPARNLPRLHMQTQAHMAAVSGATDRLSDTGESESSRAAGFGISQRGLQSSTLGQALPVSSPRTSSFVIQPHANRVHLPQSFYQR